MARRKSKLIIDDGDDDSDVSIEENDDQAVAREDDFDPNDQDEAAARQLFHNPYGHKRKRTRADLREEATYGIFAQTSDQGQHRSNRGNKSGSTAAPSITDWTK
jgi:tuftelin-interacting protein 11